MCLFSLQLLNVNLLPHTFVEGGEFEPLKVSLSLLFLYS